MLTLLNLKYVTVCIVIKEISLDWGMWRGTGSKFSTFFPRNLIELFVIIFSILHLPESNVVYKNIFRKLALGYEIFHKLKAMYIYLELWLSDFMTTSQN